MRPLVALGAAALGGVIAIRCMPRTSRQRLTSAFERWMAKHMEQMMARLPDDAPPKLVMNILPKLRAQNDQIIALLQEQNGLLRKQQRPAQRAND